MVRPAAIFVHGAYGVGKSAVLDRLGDRLAAAARPFSLLDVDWFHRSWPPGPQDPENVVTEAANLAAVWRNYRATGPRQLVVCGVVADAADRRRYEDALGLPLFLVRLVARPATVEERLRRRYGPDQAAALDWHLARHAKLADRIAVADLDELVVRTDRRPPGAVAERVLTAFDDASGR